MHVIVSWIPINISTKLNESIIKNYVTREKFCGFLGSEIHCLMTPLTRAIDKGVFKVFCETDRLRR